MTLQSQSIQYIPLNRLVVSPRSVRRKDRKSDIDALAASIASRGLLRNPCVVPVEGDRYEVDAGDRRLAGPPAGSTQQWTSVSRRYDLQTVCRLGGE